ncbi:hypothetical protein niasHT_025485 [Heterodera trifolii]|uniref:Triacylglycerol lipase n=1 Tax=Heterodera trifolii TaxID=157864 RepID=A0ABD2KT19_9BILA
MFAHLPLLLAFWSIFASAQLPVLPIVTDWLPIELLTNLTNNGECALSSECAGGCANASTIRPPLILVHGFFGNKMYLDGKKYAVPANFPLLCTQVFAARYSIKGWINPLLAVGTLNMTNIQECLFYLMSLSYDQTTDTYRNQTGVDVNFSRENKNLVATSAQDGNSLYPKFVDHKSTQNKYTPVKLMLFALILRLPVLLKMFCVHFAFGLKALRWNLTLSERNCSKKADTMMGSRGDGFINAECDESVDSVTEIVGPTSTWAFCTPDQLLPIDQNGYLRSDQVPYSQQQFLGN